MDVNANLARCIQEAHNIGSTTFVNICNGHTTVVNWGMGDWALALAGGAICLLGVTILIIGVVGIVVESWD